jgi:hypothetical protein
MEQHTKRRIFYFAVGLVSLLCIAYFIWASAGQPTWKRIVPWVLVFEFLMRGGQLTTFEKFEMMSLVSLMAMITVYLRRNQKLLYHVVELLFGAAAAWYTLSFDMTDTPALNAFLLLGSAWLVGQGIEGIYTDVGIYEENA